MNKEIGFLIIHGFAGTTEDIEPLNRYLLEKGFITLCVKLKGHTGKRADLARVNYIDWIKSSEQSFAKLSSQCKKVIVIGFSMGGLIAANISLKHDLAGIITLSTPIHHWDIKRIGLNMVEDFKMRNFNNSRRYLRSIFKIPISAMVNFKILLIKTKSLFKHIKCPIFILQGLLDDTVQYRSANYIYSNVSSDLKLIKYYNNSNHIICKSCDRDEVFNDIFIFVKNNFVI